MVAETKGTSAADAAAAQGVTGTHASESAQTSLKHSADIDISESWAVNNKALFDRHETYQADSRERARADWEDQRHMRSRQAEDLHQLKMQVMQGAIETANMVAKQALRHSDLAIDRQWNIDEVASLVARMARLGVPEDAIAAAVAAVTQRNTAAPSG